MAPLHREPPAADLRGLIDAVAIFAVVVNGLMAGEVLHVSEGEDAARSEVADTSAVTPEGARLARPSQAIPAHGVPSRYRAGK